MEIHVGILALHLGLNYGNFVSLPPPSYIQIQTTETMFPFLLSHDRSLNISVYHLYKKKKNITFNLRSKRVLEIVSLEI